MGKSEFTGSVVTYILFELLIAAAIMFTFSLALPWAYSSFKGWQIENTIIEGRQLAFHGTGTQLFGNWLKWIFFTLITIGIYGLWIPNKFKQWEVEHTSFAD